MAASASALAQAPARENCPVLSVEEAQFVGSDAAARTASDLIAREGFF
jgi:hypothetical protein